MPSETCPVTSAEELAYLILSAGSDFGIVLRAGVQVVVVGGEASCSQLLRLLRSEHAQRSADLHIQTSNLAYHVQHSLPLPLTYLQAVLGTLVEDQKQP